MRIVLFNALAACLIATSATAQEPVPDLKTTATSAEVQALIARAEREIKPGAAIMSQPLLRFAPYATNLEYRRAGTPPAVHLGEAEFFYVVEGSGTFAIGGTLVGSKPVGTHNLSGTSLDGATSRAVHAGDVFVVPENTPHGFPAIDGKLVLISMHVPRNSQPAP